MVVPLAHGRHQKEDQSDRDLEPDMLQPHSNLVHQHIDSQTHGGNDMSPPDELLSPSVRAVLLVSLLIVQHNVFVDILRYTLVVYLEPGPPSFMGKLV